MTALPDTVHALREYDKARAVVPNEWHAREIAIEFLRNRMPCDYLHAAKALADVLAKRAAMRIQQQEIGP